MDKSFSSSTWFSIIISRLVSVTRHHLIPQLVLPLIPITALVIQNGVTMNTLMSYSSRWISRYLGISTLYLHNIYSSRVSTIRRQVRGAMEIAVFIQNIQVGSILISPAGGITSYRRRGQRWPSTFSSTTPMPTLTCLRSSATIIGGC